MPFFIRSRKRVYTIKAITLEGKKDILGIYSCETESSSFWLSVLSELQNRGVKDILIVCIDGLSGFPEAIKTIFPKAEIQQCIVHQIRNSLKYISTKDQKAFLKDLKEVYRAPSLEVAEAKLEDLDQEWGKKYSIVTNSWKKNWDNLSSYFKFGPDIRRTIYTTNPIEGFHRHLRKITKTNSSFPSDRSAKKLLYLATIGVTKKWDKPVKHWPLTLSQLAIYFEGRLSLII